MAQSSSTSTAANNAEAGSASNTVTKTSAPKEKKKKTTTMMTTTKTKTCSSTSTVLVTCWRSYFRQNWYSNFVPLVWLVLGYKYCSYLINSIKNTFLNLVHWNNNNNVDGCGGSVAAAGVVSDFFFIYVGSTRTNVITIILDRSNFKRTRE